MYDLAGSKSPGHASDSPGNIFVSVFQSDGVTLLPNTAVSPHPFVLPPGVLSGTWRVLVTHMGNYNGAVITAQLAPTGVQPIAVSVSGINITSPA
jgi:hypothetical protein